MKSRAGFTLIETIVAVVILSIIAGAAAFSFRASLQSASARDALEQIKYLDSTARQRAQRFGQPVEITIDISNSTIARREGSRKNDQSFLASLPRAYRIDQVNISGRSSFDGEVVVSFSPQGHSASYAIHVTGPDFDRWILFAGMSGQMTVLSEKDESIIQDILAGTGGVRRDAD